MIKDTTERKKFVIDFVNNPTKGLDELEQKVKEARKCRNTTHVIQFLSELLFLSERTIENDLG